MAKDKDGVTIHRVPNPKNKTKSNNSNSANNKKSASRSSEKSQPADQFDKQFRKNIKILSLCIILFAFFILIALLSYSPADEAFLDIKAKDLIGLIKGNEGIIARAEMTNNWLGLVGAFIANYLYNYTFGIAIVLLPLILFYWGYELFKTQKINDKTLKYTMLILILGLVFSGVMGTFSKVGWAPNLPKELSGVAGYYIASVLYSILGGIGAMIFFAAITFSTFYFGFGFEFTRTKNALNKAAEVDTSQIKSKLAKLATPYQKLRDYSRRDSIINDDEPASEATTNNKDSNKAETNIAQTDKTAEKATVPSPILSESKLPDPTPVPTRPRPLEPRIHRGAQDDDGAARTIRQTIDFNHNSIHDESSDRINRDFADDFEEEEMDAPFIGIRNRLIDDEAVSQTPVINNINNTTGVNSIPSVNDTPSINQDKINTNNDFGDIPPYTKSIELSKEEIEQAAFQNQSVESLAPQIYSDSAEAEFPQEEGVPAPVNSFGGTTGAEIEVDPKYGIPYTDNPYARIEIARNYQESNEDEENDNSNDPSKKLNIYLHDPIENETLAKIPKSPISIASLDEKIKYTAPGLDLLTVADEIVQVDDDELKENAKTLQEKLETFKIIIENISIIPGPVVTQYEFVPAEGIKISRISNLSDDIAMALKARGIRIIAPIPGKGTVGIEIPNQKPQIVRFSSIIKSPKFYDNSFTLPMVLGKTISGEVYIADLAKMPHLLIAGATGSGKSVGINTIISSLLFRLHPRDLKFVIIDPKKVELSQYRALESHFLAISPDVRDSIITDPQDAVVVLKALCAEMDKRYDILASAHQRNISDYNKKVDDGTIKDTESFMHRRMPYIVCIIDELADLMLTARKEVENPIIRLTQLARAVGIHLVVATQRPSVDVITGLIKSNIPARASYLVATKIDSRTILDMMGAEQLLGNGDMLFLPAGAPKPERIQNAFVSNDEVSAICDFIGHQKGYSEPYLLPSIAEELSEVEAIDKSDRDPLFADAARIVVNLQNASVSLLQRRLNIGYARAGRVIDQLEAGGIIGPFEGSKSRTVFITSEEDLQYYL